MRQRLSAALAPALALALIAGAGAASAQDREDRREARHERREARQEARQVDDGAGARSARREQLERAQGSVGERMRERVQAQVPPVRVERREERREDRADRRDDRRDYRTDRREDRREFREERREDRWERRDDRQDARAWRQAQHRFRAGVYYAPRGYAVRRWRAGEFLPFAYRTRNYVIYQPQQFYLEPAPYGHFWARVGDDAVLVRAYDGMIVGVVAGLFYY